MAAGRRALRPCDCQAVLQRAHAAAHVDRATRAAVQHVRWRGGWLSDQVYSKGGRGLCEQRVQPAELHEGGVEAVQQHERRRIRGVAVRGEGFGVVTGQQRWPVLLCSLLMGSVGETRVRSAGWAADICALGSPSRHA
jgi:hypothetical protein